MRRKTRLSLIVLRPAILFPVLKNAKSLRGHISQRWHTCLARSWTGCNGWCPAYYSEN